MNGWLPNGLLIAPKRLRTSGTTQPAGQCALRTAVPHLSLLAEHETGRHLGRAQPAAVRAVLPGVYRWPPDRDSSPRLSVCLAAHLGHWRCPGPADRTAGSDHHGFPAARGPNRIPPASRTRPRRLTPVTLSLSPQAGERGVPGGWASRPTWSVCRRPVGTKQAGQRPGGRSYAFPPATGLGQPPVARSSPWPIGATQQQFMASRGDWQIVAAPHEKRH